MESPARCPRSTRTSRCASAGTWSTMSAPWVNRQDEMDDFRKIVYGVLAGFVLTIVLWISFVALSGCGFALNCAAAAPKVDRTPIPTLIPAPVVQNRATWLYQLPIVPS